MKLSPSDLRLYAVTDRRSLPAGVTLAQAGRERRSVTA